MNVNNDGDKGGVNICNCVGVSDEASENVIF